MENILQKLPTENESQYIWRVGQAKDNGLIDSTWEELTPTLNIQCGISEEDFRGSSAWRKRYRVMQQAWDDVFSQQKFVDEHSESLQEQKRELEKERQKLYATKIEASRNLRQESRSELFYENVRYAIETLPMPEIVVNKPLYTVGDKEYLLCLADIQAGAKFELPTNAYSLEVCEQRFNKLLDDVINYIKINDITKINVVGLGDSVQGILRLTDLKLNETSVVEATVMVARLIACFLNQLTAYCYVEYFHVPTSNHSQTRPLGSKASELACEDMEYIIGNYISDMLRINNRINIHMNNNYDYIEIPIFDFNIMALHGHTIKNLDTALKDLSVTHRKLIDYIIVGHWHNGKVIPGNEHDSHDTEVLMCPSFQGTDPYAFYKLGLSSKAACKMFIFDEKYGCTGTEKFILN
jgi:hypothetical protein